MFLSQAFLKAIAKFILTQLFCLLKFLFIQIIKMLSIVSVKISLFIIKLIFEFIKFLIITFFKLIFKNKNNTQISTIKKNKNKKYFIQIRHEDIRIFPKTNDNIMTDDEDGFLTDDE